MKHKIIELAAPGEADDLRCKDGEVENGQRLFPEEAETQEAPQEKETAFKELSLQLPRGERLLHCHETDFGAREWNALFQQADGTVYYIRNKTPRESILLHGKDTGPISRTATIGDIVALLTSEGVKYALWDRAETKYIWLGKAPGAPQLKFETVAKSLPPYSYIDGELPQITADIAGDETETGQMAAWITGNPNVRCEPYLQERVKENISGALQRFLKAATDFGLYFNPAFLAASWTTNGRVWPQSDPKQAGTFDTLEAAVGEMARLEGSLRIALTLSISPHIIRVQTTDNNLAPEWRRLTDGIIVYRSQDIASVAPQAISDILTLSDGRRGFRFGREGNHGADGKKIPYRKAGEWNLDDFLGSVNGKETYGDQTAEAETLPFCRLPDEAPEIIQTVDSRLVAVWTRRQETARKINLISRSHPFLPMATSGVSEIEGEEILGIGHSLKPLSSGQLGEFPLYCFMRDGIRALTPTGGSYKDVQLISRDIALSKTSFAPLSGGEAFITGHGVMKIEGSRVSCLSDHLSLQTGVEPEYHSGMRLAFDYETACLLLYDPLTPETLLYDMESGKWERLADGISHHLYLQPKLIMEKEGRLGTLTRQTKGGGESEGQQPNLPGIGVLLNFRTRPLKLGDPHKIKKLREVELQWPGSQRLGYEVYGSMNLKRWRLLGRSTGGALHLYGSGWRYFRVDFKLRMGNGTSLEEFLKIDKPLIICGFE